MVVLGNTGNEPGRGMVGGRVIISGSCPPPGEGATMRSIEASELDELAEHLEPLGLHIDSDALVIVPSEEGPPEAEFPETSITEGFEGITLVPSARDRLPTHSPIDTSSSLHPAGQDEYALIAPLPWIIETDRMTANTGTYGTSQPGLVTTEPRANDLMLITEDNLLEAAGLIHNCSGMVLDLTQMPVINDAEIEGILVSLVSRVTSESLVFLKGNIGRVERLFRLVTELEAGGAIVDCSSTVGTRMAAALPRIGLATKAMKMREAGKFVFLGVDQQPKAKDLLVALASGCLLYTSPSPRD